MSAGHRRIQQHYMPMVTSVAKGCPMGKLSKPCVLSTGRDAHKAELRCSMSVPDGLKMRAEFYSDT